MLVVKVELWPHGHESMARELCRLFIANVGGTDIRGDYKTALMRKGETRAPWPHGGQIGTCVKPGRTGEVNNHPRKSQHVLRLVGKAIDDLWRVRR